MLSDSNDKFHPIWSGVKICLLAFFVSRLALLFIGVAAREFAGTDFEEIYRWTYSDQV